MKHLQKPPGTSTHLTPVVTAKQELHNLMYHC